MHIPAVLRRQFDRTAHRIGSIAYKTLPFAKPARYGVRVETNVPYRPTGRRAHRLDVYRPETFELCPTVLYIHGGAFSMLSKDTHRGMALMLASQGYCVFNINYRLIPKHAYPKPLEDASAALLWVLENGTSYGADTSRLAIMGESAGGNLTSALTYIATHPRPEPFAQAVFDRCPPLRASLPIYGLHQVHDIERLWRDRPDRKRAYPWVVRQELEYIERAYLGDAKEAELASPLTLFRQAAPQGSRPLPPFFIAVGTNDPIFEDSRSLSHAVVARGGSSELHVYPGEIHAFNALLWRRAAQHKWRSVFRFLNRHVRPVQDAGPRVANLFQESASIDRESGTMDNLDCSTTKTA